MSMIRALVLTILALGVSGSVMAAPVKLDMRHRADLFHLGLLQLLEGKSTVNAKGDPRDACVGRDIAVCVNYVAGPYSNANDRLLAARSCRGNFGKDCAEYVAGPYANSNDRFAAARACSGNFNKECVEYVAGPYANSVDRLTAASACRLTDAECARQVAGPYANYIDRTAAAKACGDQR